jgi:hypothetical protein
VNQWPSCRAVAGGLLRGSRRPGSGGLCQAFGGIPTQPPSTSLPITGVPIIAAREKEAIDAFQPVNLRRDTVSDAFAKPFLIPDVAQSLLTYTTQGGRRRLRRCGECKGHRCHDANSATARPGSGTKLFFRCRAALSSPWRGPGRAQCASDMGCSKANCDGKLALPFVVCSVSAREAIDRWTKKP